MWECSAMNNELKPRSSRARPSTSGRMPSSVMNVAIPNLMAPSYPNDAVQLLDGAADAFVETLDCCGRAAGLQPAEVDASGQRLTDDRDADDSSGGRRERQRRQQSGAQPGGDEVDGGAEVVATKAQEALAGCTRETIHGVALIVRVGCGDPLATRNRGQVDAGSVGKRVGYRQYHDHGVLEERCPVQTGRFRLWRPVVVEGQSEVQFSPQQCRVRRRRFVLHKGDGETGRGPAQHGQGGRYEAVRGRDERPDPQVAVYPVPQGSDLRLGADEGEADRRLRVEQGKPGLSGTHGSARQDAGSDPAFQFG